ncbi:hypothetical protein F4804DRAFT_345384 [Jackrogersella minutella]|nr:hypothetical protein F4804DRAFT_345384 [Jackrogersella minutella]
MSSTGRTIWRQQARLLTGLATRPRPTTLPTRTSLRPRFRSTRPPPSARQTRRRLDAILARTARFVPERLHPYLQRLRSAPLSHVAAFLVLHEATAVLPLFGLAYLFHSMDWVPTAWVFGPWAVWAEEGLARYMRWFRKKGWFGLSEEEDGGREGEERLEERLKEEVEREKEDAKGRNWWAVWKWRDDGAGDDTPGIEEQEAGADAKGSKTATAWRKVKKAVTVDNTEKGYKIGVQIAAAYAITKVLLIPRIALSLWATPWLARVFVVARRSIWKKRG